MQKKQDNTLLNKMEHTKQQHRDGYLLPLLRCSRQDGTTRRNLMRSKTAAAAVPGPAARKDDGVADAHQCAALSRERLDCRRKRCDVEAEREQQTDSNADAQLPVVHTPARRRSCFRHLWNLRRKAHAVVHASAGPGAAVLRLVLLELNSVLCLLAGQLLFSHYATGGGGGAGRQRDRRCCCRDMRRYGCAGS